MPTSKFNGGKSGENAHQYSVTLPVKEPIFASASQPKKKRESSYSSSSDSSRSGHGGAAQSGIGSLWQRHRREKEDSITESNRSRVPPFGNNLLDMPRAKVGAPSAARQYEFEWQEPSFFKPDVSQPLLDAENGVSDPATATASPPITADAGNAHAGSASAHFKFGGMPTPVSEGENMDGTVRRESDSTADDKEFKREGTIGLKRERGSNTREGNALRVWALNLRLEKFVLMEVAWGTHQLVEMSAAEVIKRVRMHGMMSTSNQHDSSYNKASSKARNSSMEQNMASLMKRKPIVGEITYRDIRQVFSEAQRNPSLEIRRNCIILCLPPLTALVFHDRCVFLVNEDIDVDSLILRLEDITGTYSAKAEETERFFLETSTDDGAIFETVGGVAEEQMVIVPPAGRAVGKGGMLLSAGSSELEKARENPTKESGFEKGSTVVPRFVLFPLEFAILEILISCAFEATNSDLEMLERRQERVKEKVKQERQPQYDRLEELHEIKAPVESFADKMGSLSKAFKELLSSSEDMMYMELTKLYYKPHLYYKRLSRSNQVVNPNLEILLEFFDQEVEQFERRSHMILRNVENAERYVNLKMALTRNELVYWDLTSTILTVGLGGGACIGGVFGMNIQSGIEDSSWLFYFFTGTIVISCLSGLVAIAILRHKYR